MPTTLKRTAFNPVQTFRQHRTIKSEVDALSARATEIGNRLKDYIAQAHSRVNEKGSQFVDFEETVEVGGVPYKGMERRRSVTPTFNEEKAEAILRRKEKKDATILADAQSSYIDQDKVYRLLAEDRLTEKEVNDMFEDTESWALYAVKGEVI